MKRRTPLRSDPEATREWQRRSREKQIEAQRSGNGKFRSGRIKARRKSARERDDYIAKVYGSRERLFAVKAMPCSVPGCDHRPSENHHLHAGRDGRIWQNVVPLCFEHHLAYHSRAGSPGYFETLYRVDLEAVARRLAEEIPANGRAA